MVMAMEEEGTPFPDYVKRCCVDLDRVGRFPRTLNKHDGCMQYLDVSHDNLTVTYIGRGRDDTEAAAIRADASIPSMHLPVFYFEIKVESKGRDGYMSVGIMTTRCPMDKLVGWEAESLGYHGDDGLLFKGNSGHGDEFGPEWSQGDVVGCGIDFVEQRAFFVKNGIIVNYCELPKVGTSAWYPAVGLRTPGEKVRIDFVGPFVYDILGHLDRKTYKLVRTIAQQAVPDSQVQDLLLFYLLYHGYEETFYRVLPDICSEPRRSTLLANPKLKLYFEEKRMQREAVRLVDAGEIGHLRTLLEKFFPQISLMPMVQVSLTGVELLEIAFKPGNDIDRLTAKANELQACYQKKPADSQSFFEVYSSLLFW